MRILIVILLIQCIFSLNALSDICIKSELLCKDGEIHGYECSDNLCSLDKETCNDFINKYFLSSENLIPRLKICESYLTKQFVKKSKTGFIKNFWL